VRRIATSGGLELGPREGPWIDIIPAGLTRRNVTLELGKQAARWGRWHPIGSGHYPPSAFLKDDDWEGVLCVWKKESVALRFLHRPGQSSTLALKAIEAAEPDLPPAIIAAVITACRLKDRMTDETSTKNVSDAVRSIADVASLRPPGYSDYSRKDINRFAEQFLDTVASGGSITDAPMPEGAVDLGRFLIEVSRRLWRTEVRSMLIAGNETPVGASPLSIIAISGAYLNHSQHVEVAGINLYLEQAAYWHAWRQVMAWEHGRISQEALTFLTAGRFPTGVAGLNRIAPGDQDPPRSYDPDVARGITTALLREAREEASYVPSGQFVVHLPDGYPIREWGLSAMRVWARPDHLWVMMIDTDNKPCGSFRWAPSEACAKGPREDLPSRWVMSDEAAPLVDLTMAALWRDLRCAGGDAVPLPSLEHRRRSSSKASRPARQAPRSKSRAVCHLPRQRRVALGGQRIWGDQIDREIIERRAHGVRGHLRRLHPGWRASEEARQIARSFSLRVPDGYTFVRPHVRGEHGDEELEAPEDKVIVIAQGLATVMALL